MLRCRDPDVSHTVEQALEADPRLGPGQRRAGARVGAVAEGEMLAGAGAVGNELTGTLELRVTTPRFPAAGCPAGTPVATQVTCHDTVAVTVKLLFGCPAELLR